MPDEINSDIPNPLDSVDPMSLEELMTRDLEELTPKDMEAHLRILVPELRALRKKAEVRDNSAHKGGKYGKGPLRALPKGIENLDEILGDGGELEEAGGYYDN